MSLGSPGSAKTSTWPTSGVSCCHSNKASVVFARVSLHPFVHMILKMWEKVKSRNIGKKMSKDLMETGTALKCKPKFPRRRFFGFTVGRNRTIRRTPPPPFSLIIFYWLVAYKIPVSIFRMFVSQGACKNSRISVNFCVPYYNYWNIQQNSILKIMHE